MKVFIDSNVILDVFLNRPLFVTDSLKILQLSETKKIKGLVSSATIADIFYIANKQLKNNEKVLNNIAELLTITNAVKVNKKCLQFALTLGWNDFEDAIQYAVASYAHAKVIITRNVKDFESASISVYTPKEFLTKFFPYF